MSLKIKVNNAAKDVWKFAKLALERNSVIRAAEDKDVTAEYPINETAKQLHPNSQKMLIEEITDRPEAKAKTFVLKREDGKQAAMFRAGQYVSVLFTEHDFHATRPYSICSSPKDAIDGRISVTVSGKNRSGASFRLLNNKKVGDEITISGPQGNFYYEPLRDEKSVVAVAGGSGVTPFLSMAHAIKDGFEDFGLTILYGVRNKKSILFKDELDSIRAECKKVKVVYILEENAEEEEKEENYEHGYVTAEIIKKYSPEKYSLFVCGPKQMYSFILSEAEKLGLPRRLIRTELQGVTDRVWEEKNYPAEMKDKTFNLTVIQSGKEYRLQAPASSTVLSAIEKGRITAPSSCLSGECGFCRSKLISGEIFTPEDNEFRRWADIKNDWIHPCCSFPLSDIVIEIPDAYMK